MNLIGLGDRMNISAVGDCPSPVDFFGRLRAHFSWSQENGWKFVFYSAQGEKSETEQSHSSFCGLGNGGDLRHMLYLASLARPSAAVGQDRPAGARYRGDSTRPPSCSSSNAPTVGMILSRFGALKYF